ncbi:MAG TPA: dihydrofolate reductase family protein [Polyangiaceae bacterium]|jgi:dihydrofolate reductase
MRKIILRMQTSVDAIIEGPKGVDWIQRSEGDQWKDLFAELRDADTFLLGRVMYPGYAEHWRAVLAGTRPGSADEVAFAQHAETTKHVVVSRTMSTSDWKNTTFVRDLDAVAAMKKESGKNIIVWGGATLASALLDAGLLDECQLTVNPVVLGSGKPLLAKVTERRGLRLIGTKTFSAGLVQLRYATVSSG